MLQKIMRRDFDESVDLGNLETVLLMLNLPFFWIDAHKKLRWAFIMFTQELKWYTLVTISHYEITVNLGVIALLKSIILS